MKFQTKIFLTTLIILASTLSLNSILSISTFENFYVDSLISIYEASGKNLKRKIDHSLKLGKPLDRFQGMDELLRNFIKKNQYIEFTGIVDSDNEILYHTDPSRKGNFLEFKIPEPPKNKKAVTKKINDFYFSFLPLTPIPDETRGYIFLGFQESSINKEINQMTLKNIKNLSMVILVTGFICICLMGLLIIKPFKKEVGKIILKMDKLQDNAAKKISRSSISPEITEKTINLFNLIKVKNEIMSLRLYIDEFHDAYLNGKKEIESLKEEFFLLKNKVETFSQDSEKLIQNYLEIYSGDTIVQPILKSIIMENLHIKELMDLHFLYLTSTEKHISGKNINEA